MITNYKFLLKPHQYLSTWARNMGVLVFLAFIPTLCSAQLHWDAINKKTGAIIKLSSKHKNRSTFIEISKLEESIFKNEFEVKSNDIASFKDSILNCGYKEIKKFKRIRKPEYDFFGVNFYQDSVFKYEVEIRIDGSLVDRFSGLTKDSVSKIQENIDDYDFFVKAYRYRSTSLKYIKFHSIFAHEAHMDETRLDGSIYFGIYY